MADDNSEPTSTDTNDENVVDKENDDDVDNDDDENVVDNDDDENVVDNDDIEMESNEEKKENKDLPPLEEGWEDISDDRGILKKILKQGQGPKPPDGSTIICHYVGTLKENGKKIRFISR